MSDAGDPKDRDQDPRVERLRPDSSQPAPRVRTLEGLWGESDRPGFRRLYFTIGLDAYAEFRVDDVLDAVDIPPERLPFRGERATRVTLPAEAPVDITRSKRAGTIDQFDLNVRFGRGRISSASLPELSSPEAGPCLLLATPPDDTCQTCFTCDTCFGQATCGCPPETDTCDTCFGCPRR